MIWTVVQTNLRRLRHNRAELLLTFVVPIAFFSIFAVIFGGGLGSSTTPKIKVIAVDEVDSTDSRAVLQSLRASAGLRFMRDARQKPLSRQQAQRLVRSGSVTMAIVLQAERNSLRADLLLDASDQIAGQVVSALVTKSLMLAAASRTAAAAAAVRQPLAQAAPLSESRYRLAGNSPQRSTESVQASDVSPPSDSPIRIIDVIGEGKSNPVVSMYAAGIAVMFLLFGAAGGGGALLEERENQTLDRLLSTSLSMDQLLLGKWFYLTAVGILQVSVMFLWGQIVFGVDLLGHLDGFVMMTVVTASAAAAFGLLLATLCQTRGQLNGLSVILVLSMSALGGSMVPRYVMSEGMRAYGMWTFNAWALDGYDKVFWRELPVTELWPQLSVLMLSGVAFLLTARLLAVRWESN